MAYGAYYSGGKSRVVSGTRCNTCNVVGTNTPFDKAHEGHKVEPAVIGRVYSKSGPTNEYHELPKRVVKNPNTIVTTMKKGNQWRGIPAKEVPGTWVKTPRSKRIK
jgi:hypothetical protein